MQTPTPEVTSDIADNSAAPPVALTPDELVADINQIVARIRRASGRGAADQPVNVVADMLAYVCETIREDCPDLLAEAANDLRYRLDEHLHTVWTAEANEDEDEEDEDEEDNAEEDGAEGQDDGRKAWRHFKVKLVRETTEFTTFEIVVRVEAESPEEARRYVEDHLDPMCLPDINDWKETDGDVVGEDSFWVAEVGGAAAGEDLSGCPEVIDHEHEHEGGEDEG